MKKKLLIRCLVGAPLGLAISYVITILISLTMNNGVYYSVVPELIESSGNELKVVILQAVFSLLYGAIWAGASMIWEQENWSLLKQTLIHLVVSSLATFPIAYFTYWMPHTIKGILLYFGIFLAIYLLIWLSQFSRMRKQVRQFNEKMRSTLASDEQKRPE